MKTTLKYAAILWVLLLSSCTQEKVKDCSVILSFKYDYNIDKIDKHKEQVKSVELFIYTLEGNFYGRRTIPITGALSYPLPLPVGNYEIIAWGNIDETNYEINDQNLTDFKLNYRHETVSYDATPQNGLFYGRAHNISVTGQRAEYCELSLRKNTKKVEVIIGGLPSTVKSASEAMAIENTQPQCQIRVENRAYDNQNNPSGLLISEPTTYAEGANHRALFNTLRLTAALSDKSVLEIRYRKKNDDKESIIFKESLVDLILKNPKIDDLDRWDEFLIEILFDGTYMNPQIKINGWSVIVDRPDL